MIIGTVYCKKSKVYVPSMQCQTCEYCAFITEDNIMCNYKCD